jgi:hypothetical protein
MPSQIITCSPFLSTLHLHIHSQQVASKVADSEKIARSLSVGSSPASPKIKVVEPPDENDSFMLHPRFCAHDMSNKKIKGINITKLLRILRRKKLFLYYNIFEIFGLNYLFC